ncbi:uncharacterized protein [Palaemon carinicauda]|uniref:uncharacterized protein n=1 Tax=Palaemon carinicauda TaxID=392227 RepID=UPI0035B64D01
MGKSTDAESASFVQKHISCRYPSQVDEPKLHENVTKYQTHTCGQYCLKKFKNMKFKSGNKEVACWFGFPRPTSKHFNLHDILSSVIARRSNRMKKHLYDLPGTEEERRINNYNPALLYLWGGNMDIQFLSEDSYSIGNYITKYITKAEKSNLKFMDFKDLSKSTFQNLSKFAYACLKSREMGAHEAADRILHNHGKLWRSSETFVWVQTAPVSQKSRVMKNIKTREGQRPDSDDIFYPDVIHDFYPNRPRNETFDDMTLNDFVTKYDKVAGPSREGEPYIRIETEDGTYIRTMKRRPKEPVVYSNEYSVERQPELFYYSMLSLYKPWRKEVHIMGKSESYQEEFFGIVDSNAQIKEMAGRKLNIQKAREKMEKAADAKINEDGLASDVQDQEDDDYEHDSGDGAVLDQGLTDYQAVNNSSEIRTEEDLVAFVSTLNTDQLRVYNKVTQHLEQMFEHGRNSCENIDCRKDPLLLYISGFVGTGKSYLIKAIQGFMFVQAHVFKEKAGLVLAAPTGLAASNIGGQTLHSVLKLPVEQVDKQTVKYHQLRKRHLDQTRQVMTDMKALVIDEISMVSNSILLFINLRLQEVFGNAKFFGGKCILAFGDLLQLPPVKGQPVFQEISADDMQDLTCGVGLPLNLWENFSFDELTINQRQAGSENASDPSSSKDYLEQVINQYDRLKSSDPSVICLVATKKLVNEFNIAIMTKKFPDAVTVTADDVIDRKTPRIKRSAEAAVRKLDRLKDSRNTAGLEKSLKLAVGMKVMLHKNIDVANGLVNGSVGTITKIHFRNPNNRVNQLSVKFGESDENFELTRDTCKIEIFPDAFLHCTQFPICVAYALTINKAQGLSLSTVLADLGTTVFECGQTYVTLSRCKMLKGLHLINFAPKKVKVNMPALVEYRRLGSEPPRCTDGAANRPNLRDITKERIWYVTSVKKKAKSTMEHDIKTSLDGLIGKTKGEGSKREQEKKSKEEEPPRKTNKNPSERGRGKSKKGTKRKGEERGKESEPPRKMKKNPANRVLAKGRLRRGAVMENHRGRRRAIHHREAGEN